MAERVPSIQRGRNLKVKLIRAVVRVTSFGKGRLPDVVRALLHREDLWGKPFSAWLQAVLRGPSAWSVSERELFAGFTSDRNKCRF